MWLRRNSDAKPSHSGQRLTCPQRTTAAAGTCERPERGRSVLVTGASTSVGRAVAHRFQAEGDRVAATYRTSVPDGERFLAVQCDETDARQVRGTWRAVEERHGPIQVLVTNAGLTRERPGGRRTFPSCVVRESLYGMLRGEFGRIILMGDDGWSRATLLDLARRLTVEYASHGITANVVAPRPGAGTAGDQVRPPQRGAPAQQIPLGSLALPEEVALAVHWISTAEGISGTAISVDYTGVDSP